MVKSEYKNAIRSKNLIKKYFLELLIETKDIKKITVTEIVKRAGINRGTFYAHYNDVYDVEQEISYSYVEKIKKLIEDNYKNPNQIINRINNYVKQNHEVILGIHDIYTNTAFSDRFKDVIIEVVTAHVHSTDPEVIRNATFDASFLAYGVVGLYRDYLSGKLDISIDELSDLFNEQIFNASFYTRSNIFNFK